MKLFWGIIILIFKNFLAFGWCMKAEIDNILKYKKKNQNKTIKINKEAKKKLFCLCGGHKIL